MPHPPKRLSEQVPAESPPNYSAGPPFPLNIERGLNSLVFKPWKGMKHSHMALGWRSPCKKFQPIFRFPARTILVSAWAEDFLTIYALDSGLGWYPPQVPRPKSRTHVFFLLYW